MLTTYVRQSGYFAYFFASAAAALVIQREPHTSRNSPRFPLSTPYLPHNTMRAATPDPNQRWRGGFGTHRQRRCSLQRPQDPHG